MIRWEPIIRPIHLVSDASWLSFSGIATHSRNPSEKQFQREASCVERNYADGAALAYLAPSPTLPPSFHPSSYLSSSTQPPAALFIHIMTGSVMQTELWAQGELARLKAKVRGAQQRRRPGYALDKGRRIQPELHDVEGVRDDRLQKLMRRAERRENQLQIDAQNTIPANEVGQSQDESCAAQRVEEFEEAAAITFPALRSEFEREARRCHPEQGNHEQIHPQQYEAVSCKNIYQQTEKEKLQGHEGTESVIEESNGQPCQQLIASIEDCNDRIKADHGTQQHRHLDSNLEVDGEQSSRIKILHRQIEKLRQELDQERSTVAELRCKLEHSVRQCESIRQAGKDERDASLLKASDLHAAELAMALAERDVAHMEEMESLKRINAEQQAASMSSAESREKELVKEKNFASKARDNALDAAAQAQADTLIQARLAKRAQQEANRCVEEVESAKRDLESCRRSLKDREEEQKRHDVDREAALKAVFSAIATSLSSVKTHSNAVYEDTDGYHEDSDGYDEDDDIAHEGSLLKARTVDLHHALRIINGEEETLTVDARVDFDPVL